jgi:hypothetical protein
VPDSPLSLSWRDKAPNTRTILKDPQMSSNERKEGKFQIPKSKIYSQKEK